MNRLWLALEAAIVFLLIMGQIWIWPDYQWLAAVPLLMVFGSWYLRRDGLINLGLKMEWPEYKELRVWMFLIFLIFWLVIFLAGAIWNPEFWKKVTDLNFWSKFVGRAWDYYPWAVLQQVWVNGYFTNRIYSLTNDRRKTAFIIAALFAVAHFPNPVLMAVTFFGGFFSALFFLNARNVYILALAHVILGASVRMILDYSLRVGPGFLNP